MRRNMVRSTARSLKVAKMNNGGFIQLICYLAKKTHLVTDMITWQREVTLRQKQCKLVRVI